jgi:hypothetical protein
MEELEWSKVKESEWLLVEEEDLTLIIVLPLIHLLLILYKLAMLYQPNQSMKKAQHKALV